MRVEHKIIEWFTLAELKARDDHNAYDKAKVSIPTESDQEALTPKLRDFK